MDVTSLVGTFFNELDNSLEKLSSRQEHLLPNLPPWVLCNRRIRIFFASDSDLYLVEVERSSELEADQVTQENVKNLEDVQLNVPVRIGVPKGKLKELGSWLGDFVFAPANSPYAEPILRFEGVVVQATADIIERTFSLEDARLNAFEMWHEAVNQVSGDSISVVVGLQKLITRLRDVTKRKAFLERRVHRLINGHPRTFLPEHEKVYFEHPLYLNGETRVADFILKRSHGQPALLIELENPSHRIFTKKGDYTKETSHAMKQIAEWVSFIRNNSDNIKGEMEFLSGPIERLVVIGRGLDTYKRMLETRHTDTLLWTYDLLIESTVERWNRVIEQQCELLGIPDPGRLH